MRALQISDNDVFGHRFNGFDLSADLRAAGHESECLVWTKHSRDRHTHVLASQHPQRLGVNQLACSLQDTYGAQAVFTPFSYDVLFHPAYLAADVVHLHLIHNLFFSILHLPIISRLKPVVWTLHDPWALTGHCVHPFTCDRWKQGCGTCPSLGSFFPVQRDATALNAEIKRLVFASSDIDLIVASKWMEDRVRASPLFQNARVHRVPFGVDASIFQPLDRAAARARLGVPHDHLSLGLRAIEGEFKGLDTIRDALRRIEPDRKLCLVTFNNKGLLDEFRNRFRVIDLGWVQDDAEMARAFNAIDVFLMPSAAESFGMMAMEAMACGTPSIVTAGTALEETVRPEEGAGVVIPQGDSHALASAIMQLEQSPDRRLALAERALRAASTHYTKTRYVSDIVRVYDSAIARRPDDPRVQQILAELRACPVPPMVTPASLHANATTLTISSEPPVPRAWIRAGQVLFRTPGVRPLGRALRRLAHTLRRR